MILLRKIIDKALILFIFLNVFAFDFAVIGIPLRYLLLIILVILTQILSPQEFQNKQFVNFLLIILFIYSFLGLYSIILGNELSNIMSVIRPFSILLLIPVFTLMIRKKGIERYVKAFVFSVSLLIVFFVFLLLFSIINPSEALNFSNSQDLVMILMYGFFPRVVIKTFVFVPSVALYTFIKYDGKKSLCFFFLFLLISVLSQTFAIIIVVVLEYIFVLLARKDFKSLMITGLLLFCTYIVIFLPIESSFLDVKEGSVSYKSQQVSNVVKDMDGFKILTGRGIGETFTNMDSRKEVEKNIEVSAVQLFQYGGLLFSWLLLYVYFAPIRPLLTMSPHNKGYYIGYSQLGIIIASLSNPYLWGGGMGLFFIILAVAYKSTAELAIERHVKINNSTSSLVSTKK